MLGDNGTCGVDRSPQELLAEFQQTGRQEPFEEIARRYAGMVYNVALQVTRDAHDAEDAAQATFLTLAVHAKTAGKIRYLGPWLRKVAHRLALDIRRSKKRRKAREERHANGNGNGEGPPVSHDLHMEELRHILREELDKLPSKYRMPLILYYFGGLSPDQMGKELRCNTSTLGVRLHRGRKMLAESLAGRGISINAAMLTALLTSLTDTFVMDNLVHRASRSAANIAASGFVADAAVTTQMVELIRSASSAMAWSRIKAVIAAAVLLASSLAGGTEVLRRYELIDANPLRQIDLLQFIRPLLDKLLPSPNFTASIEVPRSADPIGPPLGAVALGGPFDLKFSPQVPLAWSTVAGAAPQHMTGSIQSVGFHRLLASQLRLDSPASGKIGAEARIPHPGGSAEAHTSAALPIELAPLSIAPVAGASSAQQIGRIALNPPQPTAGPVYVFDRQRDPGDATLVVSEGYQRAQRLIVGETSVGSFYHDRGRIDVAESVVIAEQSNSAGTYQMTGSAQLTTPSLVVGAGGTGHFEQTGGLVVIGAGRAGSTPPLAFYSDAATFTPPAAQAPGFGTLTIARDGGSLGSYVLSGGTLVADSVIIGQSGAGTFQQTGGVVITTNAVVGNSPGSTGTWSIAGDSVVRVVPPPTNGEQPVTIGFDSPAPTLPPAIVVGALGDGIVIAQSGRIEELPGTKGALYVRADQDGEGVLRGWGVVRLTGRIVQNGRIIADGFGARRTLDLSSATSVTNSIENPVDGGTNGWFVRNGGALVLPPIDIVASDDYTWGEERLDPIIDLVNSVRIEPRELRKPGHLSLTLLDPIGYAMDPLPGGEPMLALWHLESTALFDSIELIVRYDDVQAAIASMPESHLGLWAYDGHWHALTDGAAGVDVHNNLVWGTARNPSYIAVALIPEPSWLALAAFSGAAMLRRRRH